MTESGARNTEGIVWEVHGGNSC